jgi:hypothetical protein
MHVCDVLELLAMLLGSVDDLVDEARTKKKHALVGVLKTAYYALLCCESSLPPISRAVGVIRKTGAEGSAAPSKSRMSSGALSGGGDEDTDVEAQRQSRALSAVDRLVDRVKCLTVSLKKSQNTRAINKENLRRISRVEQLAQSMLAEV